jgi:hypothetical protein
MPSCFSLARLHRDLQRAIGLEFAVLPAYLTALYSIKEGTNAGAIRAIRGVAMEEMYHLTLAANVLNAVGGSPVLDATTVPRYPLVPFPGSPDFELHIEPFSRVAIERFLRVEAPVPKDAAPNDETYTRIGELYAAIEGALECLDEEMGSAALFSGDPKRQVTSEQYYGGGGVLVTVHDLPSALHALRIIVDQGEGLPESILDGDHTYFEQDPEVAHYFRFNEILEGRYYYIGRDRPADPPSGETLAVDWDAVWPAEINPDPSAYTGQLAEASHAFNSVYSTLVDHMQVGLNGQPETLMAGVIAMMKMKYAAQALMRVPFGVGTAAPTYDYIEFSERT